MKNEEWVDGLQDGLADDELDDLEPTATGDEAQLYEHFRVVVDKGQEMVRVDKYLFDRTSLPSRWTAPLTTTTSLPKTFP